MKKRFGGVLLALTMLLSACGAPAASSSAPAESKPAQSAPAVSEPAVSAPEIDDYVAQVASLKGPTSIGMAQLMLSDTANFAFTMYTDGSEIVPLMVKGEVDIALIPANLAATLYQKTEGGIEVININTLGVLDVVAPADTEISSFADLAGKTIYMTGKGTTPEGAVRYLTEQNGMEELDIEFQSEATAVVSALAANPDAIAILPQPFATVAVVQNEGMEIKLSLTDEWDAVAEDGSSLLTGVTVVRKDFAEEHPALLETFLESAAESVAYVNGNVEAASALVEELDIVKAGVAKQAIPRCNLVSITGAEMQEKLSGYLNALYAFEPSMVGGELPGEDFYYIP